MRGMDMVDFFEENIEKMMLMQMVVVMMIGYKVDLEIDLVGFELGLIGIELGIMKVNMFGEIKERILGKMQKEKLIEIKLFKLMGIIIERRGMVEDMIDKIGKLLGKVRGGIEYEVIIVGEIMEEKKGVVEE